MENICTTFLLLMFYEVIFIITLFCIRKRVMGYINRVMKGVVNEIIIYINYKLMSIEL